MSRFFSERYRHLVPYVPGEQPKDKKYIKLNTNESPFPPSPLAVQYAAEAAGELELYPDPTCGNLVTLASSYFGVDAEEIIFTNGSDEILNFAFIAFCDKKHPAVFPDITYGFYQVFADLNGVPYTEIPLQDDFSVNIDDYMGVNKTIFIANPNAPTGLMLPISDIEKIIQSNPDSVVVVDEAYVDFAEESCVSLIHRYDNLLVTQTFSKSRSMAGGRLGIGFGCKALIKDINAIKYSTNPYNINRMTMAAGLGALKDDTYTKKNCAEIKAVRKKTSDALQKLGFTMPASSANFIFVKHESVDAALIYKKLREKGILVRYFDKPRLRDYIRITIGTREQMETLVSTVDGILEENQ